LLQQQQIIKNFYSLKFWTISEKELTEV